MRWKMGRSSALGSMPWLLRLLLLLLLLSTCESEQDAREKSDYCLKCMISYEEVEFEDGAQVENDSSARKKDFTCTTDAYSTDHPDSTYAIDLPQGFLYIYGEAIYAEPKWFCVHNGAIDLEKSKITSFEQITPFYEKDVLQIYWRRYLAGRQATKGRELGGSFFDDEEEDDEDEDADGDDSERPEPKLGLRTVLVARVFSADAPASMTREEIRNQMFSEGDNRVDHSIATQFYKCSGGKLDLIKLTGYDQAKDGIVDLDFGTSVELIGQNIASGHGFRNLIHDALHNKLGVNYLPDVVDHVVFVLPDGIVRDGNPNWASFANWYRTYFRGERARSLSSTMHEIGHTLGLKHAGEGDYTYGDKSSYMGATYKDEEKPLMCFNGAQHWQMGWYRDREVRIRPNIGKWNGMLLGFADHDKDLKGTIILNLGDAHIQYNRAKDFNQGAREKRNEVTITQWTKKGTWILTGLRPMEHFNYEGLRITFCEHHKNEKSGAEYARVTVFPINSRDDYCSMFAAPPTPSPSKSLGRPTLKGFKPADGINLGGLIVPAPSKLLAPKKFSPSPTSAPVLESMVMSPIAFTQGTTELPKASPTPHPAAEPTPSPIAPPSPSPEPTERIPAEDRPSRRHHSMHDDDDYAAPSWAHPSSPAAPYLSPSAPDECDSLPVVIEIRSDQDAMPDDESWYLKDVTDSYEVLTSHAARWSPMDDLFVQEACLETNGCYQLYINDEYEGLELYVDGEMIFSSEDIKDHGHKLAGPTFGAGCPKPRECDEETEIKVELTIVLDGFPSDISYEVVNEEYEVLISGSDLGDPHETYGIAFCAPKDDCYRFQIMDDFGDGLGEGGRFEISADGEIVYQGREFKDTFTSPEFGDCI